MLLALKAYQDNPKLSLRRAAKIYRVHYTTLFYRKHGMQARANANTNSKKLPNLEERIIFQHILSPDPRRFPPRLCGAEEMAIRLLADRDASPVGKRWAMNFVKRQPELKTRFQRRYDYQRAKCEDPTIIRNWFRLVQNTIVKYGIRLDDIYNFDETGFIMGMFSSGIVITRAERHGKPKSIQPGNRKWVTATQAINAEG
ncbi:hypothetical protein FocnCong_v015130 [Fusarium oxysporum f. sp. conglutinans]|nr:hypothetical protein FocnCong_v015130 [Fusarium oxysporum f. sp. conglutinans]